MTFGRRLFRRFFQALCRVVVFICTRTIVHGRENYPARGPALIVINHLGDPDAVLVVAALPDFPEVIGKIELRDITVLRWLGDMLGVIWVHRGQPDRRAISAALQAFRLGRCVLIAPEGRESVSGALEPGTEGAAYLALQAGVPGGAAHHCWQRIPAHREQPEKAAPQPGDGDHRDTVYTACSKEGSRMPCRRGLVSSWKPSPASSRPNFAVNMLMSKIKTGLRAN